MPIQLNPNYRLDMDGCNVTLQERKEAKKTGKEYWQDLAHCVTLEYALVLMLRHHVAPCKDALDAINRMREVEKWILSLNLGNCKKCAKGRGLG